MTNEHTHLTFNGDKTSFPTPQKPIPVVLPFEPIMLEGDYQVGPPSTSADHFTKTGTFSIPTGVNGEVLYGVCSILLAVDDWGFLEITDATGQVRTLLNLRQNSQTAGEQGGHRLHEVVKILQLESGTYTYRIEQENIDYNPPSGNTSICRYNIRIVPLEPGGQTVPESCDCINEYCDNTAGGVMPAARANTAAPDYSSAGSNVTADCTESYMYWACNFGAFRGLGNIPVGRIALRETDNISRLGLVSALTYNHPLASCLELPESGFVPGCRFDLVQGSRKIAFRYYPDELILPVGVDTYGGGRASLITQNGQTYFRWITSDECTYLFDTQTGLLHAYITPDGNSIENVADYLRIIRTADGDLRQIWNLWDGLLDITPIDATSYQIALYTPAQISGETVEGLYETTDDPFKKFTLSLIENEHFTITEQTPNRPDYLTEWWLNGLAWCMQQGAGQEAIVTTQTRTELEEALYGVLTEIAKNGEVARRTYSVYQSTDVGELEVAQLQAYGAPNEIVTQYEYDGAGQVRAIIAPDGSRTEFEYDFYGRQIKKDEPWAASGRQVTSTAYANSGESDFNSDIAEQLVDLIPTNGHRVTLLTTTNQYAIANHIKRTETRITGLGVTGERLTVREEWLSTAPDVYARGRIRMQQDQIGVQTWHEYVATDEHGALYKEIVETRVNNQVVPNQSTRQISWITTEGQRVHEESYVLTANNEWEQIDGATFEFDIQNRWIKRIAANGRELTRKLMCTGEVLSQTDENGIRTTNSYDSARQLVESIRSAVGDITSEIITSYKRDALGQVLELRKDEGAKTTIERFEYDLAGRQIRSVDVLGRVTQIAYSADTLVTTRTEPSGATLITRLAPDGTVLEESGTGQLHKVYNIDLANDGIRTYEIAVTEKGRFEQSRDISNGLGETLRTGTPNTLGGVIFNRNTYNNKGQIIQTQTDAGASFAIAPTLYEFDSFGNRVREVWKLANNPNYNNSKITAWTYGIERLADGIYQTVTETRNNSQGGTFQIITKTLISKLSPTLANKTITIDPRNNESAQWTEYGDNAMQTQYTQIPTSDIIGIEVSTDGFVTAQTDTTGVTRRQSRRYTATGIVYSLIDGRNNTTTVETDLAGRIVKSTDPAGNVTTTEYCPFNDQPALITNPQGGSQCMEYDIRNRLIAQFGTAIQPIVKTYDEANNLTSFTTFRADAEEIVTDPRHRTDGDTTILELYGATNLLTRKTYPNGTFEQLTYNELNFKATLTDPRGHVTTWQYNLTKATNTAINFNDGTPGLQFAYNQLNLLFRIIDAAGTHLINYNEYNEQESEELAIDGQTYRLLEQYDSFGRNTGYNLVQNNVPLQQTEQTYQPDGRLATCGVIHNGVLKSFGYSYLQGTNLLSQLSMPNGMVKEITYELLRDLPAQLVYTLNNTPFVTRTREYDSLARPTFATQKQGDNPIEPDTYGYNTRSELTSAEQNGEQYGYQFDNIGNRKVAQEIANDLTYATNNFNQYTDIDSTQTGEFIPQYDANGNQTLIKTITGIWAVTYNALNRATRFMSLDEQTVIDCDYDYLGRRFAKKIIQNGTVISHERYLYQGFLQIAALDMLNAQSVIRTILWDPTEPIATRPLALIQNNELYCYGLDFNKNVTEIFNEQGAIAAEYNYSPFGNVTAIGEFVQPIQWSSEVYDSELDLVYYNYRYYNPIVGRWISREFPDTINNFHGYIYIDNNPCQYIDILGNAKALIPDEPIFIFPQSTPTPKKDPAIHHATEALIEELYVSLNKLNNKRINGKKCYTVKILDARAAFIDDIKRANCPINFIIGHGIKINNKDYIKLKDGLFNVTDANNKGKICKAFGCYVGDNKGEIIPKTSVQQMIAEIERLLKSEHCPCKYLCVFSGPYNQ